MKSIGLFFVIFMMTVVSWASEKNKLKPLYPSAPPINYVDCFWGEPFLYGGKYFYKSGYAGSLNANIDDISATYWATRFRLAKGDALILRGQFGHNRYASIQSYANINPTDSLRDNQINADPGSYNPYQQNARRDTPMEQRWFTIKVINEPVPVNSADKLPNTLYAAPKEGDPTPDMIDLRWRSYFVDQKYDQKYDNRGGGQLPLPVKIIHADGTEEPFRCDRDPTERQFQQARHFYDSAMDTWLWIAQYTRYPCKDGLTDGFCNDPWTAPARPKPVFEKFFDVQYSELGLFMPPDERAKFKPAPNCNQEGSPGIPGNFDANYGIAFVSEEFGKVVRITAKYPKTPQTYWNNKRFDESNADLRYWSWTTGNERTTGNITDGVSDQQVPMRKDGTYSIVISLPENRPKSAKQKCGHAWANWGRHGDGAGRWGLTTLTFRNIIPLNGFTHAMQNVCEAGTEAQVMGDYYPELEYFEDAKAFDERVGCQK